MSSSSTSTTSRVKSSQYGPKPESKLAGFLWRRRIWFESTFVLSMLEPWEKILLLTIFGSLFILVLVGIFKYMPQHLLIMQRRAMYYLWGDEGDQRLLWQWFTVGRQGGFWRDSIISRKEL